MSWIVLRIVTVLLIWIGLVMLGRALGVRRVTDPMGLPLLLIGAAVAGSACIGAFA